MLFRSWNAGGEGSAAIVFDWERNVLEAVFEGAGLDLGSTPDLEDPEDDSLRRVGGPAEHVQVELSAAPRMCHDPNNAFAAHAEWFRALAPCT